VKERHTSKNKDKDKQRREARKFTFPFAHGGESSSSTTDGVSKQICLLAILVREYHLSSFSESLCGMSANELEFIAENENRKGCECLKAGEIDDAILHFHRTIKSLEAGENECFSASVQYNLSACLIHLK
jgi:hypothetical protein